MIVCFLRHGTSDPFGTLPDERRQLVDEGRRELRSAASIWGRLQLDPTVVLTSPRQRSIDSARLFIEGLDLRLEPTVAEGLAPGAEWSGLSSLLDRYPDDATVVLVGHEPDLSSAIEHLTGAKVRLREGGLCCVELQEERDAPGVLTVLLDPAVYIGQNGSPHQRGGDA